MKWLERACGSTAATAAGQGIAWARQPTVSRVPGGGIEREQKREQKNSSVQDASARYL